MRKSDYPEAYGYLDGLEVTHQSYSELLPQFFNQPKTLLLLDPPYTCTSQGAYQLENYFGMVDFIRLMQFVCPPFIFFSSTRSEFLDYVDLVVNEKLHGWDRLAGYQLVQVKASLNKAAKYEDDMVFKF